MMVNSTPVTEETCEVITILLCYVYFTVDIFCTYHQQYRARSVFLTFTFMHLADAFIQSDSRALWLFFFVSMCVPWETHNLLIIIINIKLRCHIHNYTEYNQQ